MREYPRWFKADWKTWLTLALLVIFSLALYRCSNSGQANESSLFVPPSQNNDPDWFMSVAVKEEPVLYEVTRVLEVLDGDTFKCDLSRFGRVELQGVKIRLAGVNSPERFDQNCWKEAGDFTRSWLAKSGKIFVQTWGKDTYGNRPVGFVYRSSPAYQSLEQDLVRAGLALPCLGYLKGKVSTEKYNAHKKMILDAADFARSNSRADKPSVWAPKSTAIQLSVTPNTRKNLGYGDRIVISLKDLTKTLDLSGFSIMEESSLPEHRFFIPRFVLDKAHKNLVFNTGSKYGSSWISSEGSELFAMSETDWVNDDGDTVYLRDASRRIIAYTIYEP